MKYDLVIFDFDGTLADSLPWFMARVNQVADRYGFRRVTLEDVDLVRKMGTKEVLQHFDVPLARLPQITLHIRQLMAEEHEQIGLVPGLGAMLSDLSEAGAKLAIVTSNSPATVRAMLGPENTALIDFLVGGASLFGKRPKLRKVVKSSGVDPARAIYVGDEIRDLEAAKAEGLAFGAVGWGFATAEALGARQPEESFASMHDIVERLTDPQAQSAS